MEADLPKDALSPNRKKEITALAEPPFDLGDVGGVFETFHQTIGKSPEMFSEPEELDGIEVDEYYRNTKGRRSAFDELDRSQQELIYKKIINGACLLKGEEFLRDIRLTGREADPDLATDLEEWSRSQGKELNLDSIRLTTALFRINKIQEEIKGLTRVQVVNQEVTEDRLFELTKQILHECKDISNYTLSATHRTRPDRSAKIDATFFEPYGGFHGDGLYCGVLGSYQNWAGPGAAQYEFKVNLSDCMPTLDHFDGLAYPRAEVVYPGSRFKILDGKLVSYGPKEWSQYLNPSVEDASYQVSQRVIARAMSEFSGKEVTFRKINDQDIEEVIVVDTDLPPIYWMTIGDSFNFRKMTTEDEYGKQLARIIAE